MTKFFSDSIFDVLFKDAYDAAAAFAPAINSKFTYPVDIIRTPEGLTIEVAAVGMDKEDIKITFEDGVLTVSGSKQTKTEETKDENQEAPANEEVIHRGIARRSFSHAWRVGPKYNIDALKTKLEKGLLTITIPVAETAKAKTFTIE